MEPEELKGRPLELRRDDERLTSLLGGRCVGVVSGNIGVVEPALEKAIKLLDCEPGRDVGIRLESRDDVMLLENRRNHDLG